MYLVKYIKEMNEIDLKQTFFYCSDIFTVSMRYSRLIGIPVANNIHCLTIEEEETRTSHRLF